MVQVDETKITIDCACEWPYHRLYAEYDKDEQNTALLLAVIVGAPNFWERLKAAYKILTKGEAWISELYLTRDGSEALRQFLNRQMTKGLFVTSTTSANWNTATPTIDNKSQ